MQQQQKMRADRFHDVNDIYLFSLNQIITHKMLSNMLTANAFAIHILPVVIICDADVYGTFTSSHQQKIWARCKTLREFKDIKVTNIIDMDVVPEGNWKFM